jgi:hypothetical protein
MTQVLPLTLTEFTVDHTGWETLDIEGEAEFLSASLGMYLIRWGMHAETGLRIALLDDGFASKVELIEVPELTGRYAHTALLVADVAAAHRELLERGCTEQRAPFHLEAAGAVTSFVQTPPGRLIQLIRYEADSADLTAAQQRLGY